VADIDLQINLDYIGDVGTVTELVDVAGLGALQPRLWLFAGSSPVGIPTSLRRVYA